MQIDNRRLQRRNNLRQSTSPNTLMHHNHAYWNNIDYTLFAGDNRYTTNSYRSVGARVYLNPVVLMYAVKAELILTHTFGTAGVDSYCTNLVIGSNSYEVCSRVATSYENTVIDISDAMIEFFKNFREEEAYIQVKVSNIATPLDLFGVTLRFTTFMSDTYGDYTGVTSQMLISDSDVNKSYIKAMDNEAKEFTYLSGIKPL